MLGASRIDLGVRVAEMGRLVTSPASENSLRKAFSFVFSAFSSFSTACVQQRTRLRNKQRYSNNQTRLYNPASVPSISEREIIQVGRICKGGAMEIYLQSRLDAP